MQDENKRRRISFSFSKVECAAQEINSREIRLDLPFSANWNKRDGVWKREFILKRRFHCRFRWSMLKLPKVPNLYPTDSVIGFPYTYPLDSDLFDG